MLIRDATPADMPHVGEIRVTAYHAGGFLSMDSGYLPRLRDLGADGHGEVLVAVRPAPAGSDHLGDTIVGTIMLQRWPQAGEVVTGPDEAEIRALAVVPDAQGTGVGSALLCAMIERARSMAVGHLVLCTQPDMRAARRLYERAGFSRLPDRDWSPDHGDTLLAYGMPLAGAR